MSNAHNHDHPKVTTLDLLKRYLSLKIDKMSRKKKPAMDPNISLLDRTPSMDVNHIAIVLDGKVQDIMRAQNRMAALLLSGPEFIMFDPKETQIGIGFDYINGKFIKNEEN
jgi:hypothetical protein